MLTPVFHYWLGGVVVPREIDAGLSSRDDKQTNRCAGASPVFVNDTVQNMYPAFYNDSIPRRPARFTRATGREFNAVSKFTCRRDSRSWTRSRIVLNRTKAHGAYGFLR